MYFKWFYLNGCFAPAHDLQHDETQRTKVFVMTPNSAHLCSNIGLMFVPVQLLQQTTGSFEVPHIYSIPDSPYACLVHTYPTCLEHTVRDRSVKIRQIAHQTDMFWYIFSPKTGDKKTKEKKKRDRQFPSFVITHV